MVRCAIAALVLALSVQSSVLRADELPASALTVLHRFSIASREIPTGRLAQASDGTLFGELTQGGANGGGTIFALRGSGTLDTLFSFGAAIAPEADPNGTMPLGGLVFGPDGNLYGTTPFGGPNMLGTVFRITPTGTLITLAPFGGAGQGQPPFSRLFLASDGYFYGTTITGDNSAGIIFRIDPATGTFDTVYAFSQTNSLVAGAAAELVQGPDGALYGANPGGVVRLPVGGQPTTHHLFPYQPADTMSGLTLGADGALYGVSALGGGSGFAYRITTDGVYTQLHAFGCDCGLPEGAYPYNSLLLASDGNLYGVTVAGGLHYHGVLYRLTPDGTVTTMQSFTDGDGASPAGPLIEGVDHRLYGVTSGTATIQASIFKFALLPPSPAKVSATGGVKSATLAWSPSRGAFTYNVYQGDAAGAESPAAVLSGITGTNATVTASGAGTRYYFRVSASNEVGEGAPSAEVSAVLSPEPKSGGGGSLDLASLAGLCLIGLSRCLRRRPSWRK